ncbi:MAG: hypothetical protein U0930_23065 [Pirellulales bacterium]
MNQLNQLQGFSATIRSRCILVTVVAVFATQFFSLPTTALASPRGSKIDAQAAKDTITGSWYDHKTGNYNQPELSPIHDNELRSTASSLGPGADNNWLFDLLKSIGTFLGEILRALFGILGYLGIILLILLVIWAIYYAAGIYIQTYRPLDRNVKTKTAVIDVTRIEELPFEQMQNTTDPLGVCRQLAREGRFDEAILYLYGYKLLALDHARKIHLHKGKTNRMYLRELSTDANLYSILEPTVQKFELVYFGKHSLTKQSFLEVWKLLDPFHRLIAQANNLNMSVTNSTSRVATGGNT